MINKYDRIIYLDMDGPLADFVNTALFRFVNSEAVVAHMISTWPAGSGLDGLYAMLGITQDEFWNEINQGGIDLWRNLLKHLWADELISLAEHFGDVLILSSPARGGNSASGKLLWLADKLPSYSRRFILTPKKFKHLLARPNDILIDDDPKTCGKWHNKGGEAILFPRPWNDHPDWLDPMVAVRRVLQKLPS